MTKGLGKKCFFFLNFLFQFVESGADNFILFLVSTVGLLVLFCFLFFVLQLILFHLKFPN